MAIYAISYPEGSLVKIGRAANVKIRFRGLLLSSPVPVTLLAHWEGGAQEERDLHQALAARRAHGEWFHVCPEEIVQTVSDLLGRAPSTPVDTTARLRRAENAGRHPGAPMPKWRKCYPALANLPTRETPLGPNDLHLTLSGNVLCSYQLDAIDPATGVAVGPSYACTDVLARQTYAKYGPAGTPPPDKFPAHPDLPDLRHLTPPHASMVIELGRLREATGMSLRAFAGASGLTVARIRRVEHGETLPTLPMTESWARAGDADKERLERVRRLARRAHAHGSPMPSMDD